MQLQLKKNRICETLNLLMCADSITNFKKYEGEQNHLSSVMYHVSHVICHVPPITCHLSPVTCHLSAVKCHLTTTLCTFSCYESSRFEFELGLGGIVQSKLPPGRKQKFRRTDWRHRLNNPRDSTRLSVVQLDKELPPPRLSNCAEVRAGSGSGPLLSDTNGEIGVFLVGGWVC